MAEKDRKATKYTHVKFHPEQHELLMMDAQARGADITAIIRMATAEWLEKDIPRLKLAGLWPKGEQNPQARAREGRARRKAGVVALAVFGGLTLLGQPAQTDSKVSTFVGPGVHILSTWKIRRSRLHVLKRVSGL